MKYIFSEEQLVVPEDVKIHIRSRIVTVEGPRGTHSGAKEITTGAVWEQDKAADMTDYMAL